MARPTLTPPRSPPIETCDAMRAVFPPTPLMRNDLLSARFDAEIWLKREDLSPVRSYKLRGAFNAMRKVSADTGVFVCRGWRSCAVISGCAAWCSCR